MVVRIPYTLVLLLQLVRLHAYHRHLKGKMVLTQRSVADAAVVVTGGVMGEVLSSLWFNLLIANEFSR